jgi:hypothetical protein
MKAAIRILFFWFGVALVSAPVGIVLTIALVPFWSLLEDATGVESIGHWGPAGWCYLATIAAVSCGIAALLLLRKRGN